MAVHERAARSPAAGERAIELGPPVASRATLDPAARRESIEFYFLTRAAGQAWAAINARLNAGGGAIFWICDAPGTGKTHFLNYVLAMEERAAHERMRHAMIRLDLGSAAQADDLEQRMFDLLSRAIGIADTGVALWRRLHGGEALALALDQARRVGFRAVSIAVDFGTVDASSCHDYLVALARAAARNRQVLFNIYVAARTPAPPDAVGVRVGAEGETETMIAALARARRVVNPAAAAALYEGVDLGAFDMQAIFPFAPLALPVLRSLVGPSANVAAIAEVIIPVLATWRETADCSRPILPTDLSQTPALSRLIDERLGAGGRAARCIAYRAARAMQESARAREIADTLMLEHLSGGRALSAAQLHARLAERLRRTAGLRPTAATIAGLLEALDAHSGGVIAYRSQQAWFNPRAAGAPEIAAYNLALPLLRRFDPRLGEAAEPAGLRAGLRQAGEAMARAVETAHRAAAALEVAARETRGEVGPEHRRAFDEFIALAAAGTQALIQEAAAPQARARLERAMDTYEALRAAAEAAPRVRAMRGYLRATALTAELAREPAGESDLADQAVAAAQVECQLLLGALEAELGRWELRSFDALEVRFQKFKWNYIQLYKAAHDRWRRDSERVSLQLADAREQCAALGRLNSIAALGAPAGENLAAKIEELAARAVGCDGAEPLALEFVPRCPRCGFVLGATVPDDELGELLDELKRALKTRLAALSHGAIARLIKLHDRGHRLDGFLKITQAAQTGALARVLDDNLTRYLAGLLDEIRGERLEQVGAHPTRPEKSPAQTAAFLRPVGTRMRRAGPSGRAGKPPRDA
ncbi:MAG TPA: hypothetical protein VKT27_06480 [Candidatus Binataceae bacterium]|nr:hypothetical protein [Candidatus Binataceae bacterium]